MPKMTTLELLQEWDTPLVQGSDKHKHALMWQLKRHLTEDEYTTLRAVSPKTVNEHMASLCETYASVA